MTVKIYQLMVNAPISEYLSAARELNKMKIELHELSVREIAENYVDNPADNSVTGYNGRLNIRPQYQREFVYDEKKRNAVIETIVKGFPLNVMYWVKNPGDQFEVLDGQQRTISFCQ